MSFESPEILRDYYPDSGETEAAWLERQGQLGLEPVPDTDTPGEFVLNGRPVRRWRMQARGARRADGPAPQ